ncbi:oligoribonuclease [Patescibacteria group bacterium]|nr:oligoribonuclease [Patescibacteria group bacterium]
MAQRDDLLVWMDFEMTSIVDPTVDTITEVATIITDKDLQIIAEGPQITIQADMDRFNHIPPEVLEIHKKSGIIDRVRASTTTIQEAEAETLTFISTYCAPQTAPLCGNSMTLDRTFMRLQMHDLYFYLHYRNIDVTAVKELARRWRPEYFEAAQKMKEGKTHRALDDIKGSIEELRYYRENWLK